MPGKLTGRFGRKKIGSTAGVVPITQLLGGVPQQMDLADFYLSAKTGYVEGWMLAPLENYLSMKLYEVAPYLVNMQFNAIMSLLMNQSSFDALPADIQKILTDDALAIQTKWVGEVAKSTEDTLKAIGALPGVNVKRFTATERAEYFNKAFVPVFTGMMTKYMPADQVTAAKAIIARVQADSTDSINVLPTVTGSIDRSFAWEYAGSEWTWDIPISKALYKYYGERERMPTDDYSVYVTDPLDDSFIEALVDKLQKAAQEKSFDKFETVNFAVSFVQSLPYTSDEVTTSYDEYPRYPIETLVDNGGDCEDTAILMAAILKAMGYGVILVNPPGHMAVGVLGGEGIYGSYYNHDGGKYYYLETTGSGWEIGEIPTEYKGESVSIYDIVPIPILTQTWKATR